MADKNSIDTRSVEIEANSTKVNHGRAIQIFLYLSFG